MALVLYVSYVSRHLRKRFGKARARLQVLQEQLDTIINDLPSGEQGVGGVAAGADGSQSGTI